MLGDSIYIGDSNNSLVQLGTKADLDQCFQSVSSGKSQIASAITGKGVSTSPNASFSTMASNIRSISQNVTNNYSVEFPSSFKVKNLTANTKTTLPSSAVLVASEEYASGSKGEAYGEYFIKRTDGWYMLRYSYGYGSSNKPQISKIQTSSMYINNYSTDINFLVNPPIISPTRDGTLYYG